MLIMEEAMRVWGFMGDYLPLNFTVNLNML